MTSPKALAEAAEEYVRSDNSWIDDSFSAHEDTFIAGANHMAQLKDEKILKLREALEDIRTRGTGTGGAVCITTSTLRGIARAALEATKDEA